MMYGITMNIQSCCVPRDIEDWTYAKVKYGELAALYDEFASRIYDMVYAATAADDMTAMAFAEPVLGRD